MERPAGQGNTDTRSASWLLYTYKIEPCRLRVPHDWSGCFYAHQGERAARRDPRVFAYRSVPCAYAKGKLPCPLGDLCDSAHSLNEYWLHPQRFRSELCQYGSTCRRPVCFFAHSPAELQPLDPTLPPAELCWHTGASLKFGRSSGGASAGQAGRSQRRAVNSLATSLPDPAASFSAAMAATMAAGGGAHAGAFASSPSLGPAAALPPALTLPRAMSVPQCSMPTIVPQCTMPLMALQPAASIAAAAAAAPPPLAAATPQLLGATAPACSSPWVLLAASSAPAAPCWGLDGLRSHAPMAPSLLGPALQQHGSPGSREGLGAVAGQAALTSASPGAGHGLCWPSAGSSHVLPQSLAARGPRSMHPGSSLGLAPW